MDCRLPSALLFSVVLGSGCVTTQTVQGPTNAQQPPPQGAIVKETNGPKRPPMPGTVVALAVIRERKADTMDDAAQKMKTYDEARLYFQDALQLDPKYRDAIQGLARVYTHMDDFEHALAVYQTALDKNPKDHGLWFDMGMCLNRKRDMALRGRLFPKSSGNRRRKPPIHDDPGPHAGADGSNRPGPSFAHALHGSRTGSLQCRPHDGTHGPDRTVPPTPRTGSQA